MDLSSEDALINFVNALDFVKIFNCVFLRKHGDSVGIDPQQGSLTTLMREKWKTPYSIPLIMQE